MRHFYRTIPGWFSFRALYERMVERAADGAHFVEVGSWKGRSAAFMAVEIANSKKRIRFDCIDTWLGSNEPKHLNDADAQGGRLYEVFLKNIAPVRGLINVVRLPSVQAARQYGAGSVDFAMIDAAHDYANVRADAAAWWPKIRPGGTLAGDDYLFQGVRRAVDEAFSEVRSINGSGSGVQWAVAK